MKVPYRTTLFRVALGLAFAAAAVAAVARALAPASAPAVVVTATEIEGKAHGPGTVQAKVSVTISSKITGVIAQLHADQGDRVKSGQLLAELDATELTSRAAAAQAAVGRLDRDLARARADRLKAEANLGLVRSNYERDREVFEPGYISAAAFDASKSALRVGESEVAASNAAIDALEASSAQARHDASAAKEVLGYTRIFAPMDGLIIARRAEVGATIVPGAPIFQVVGDRIWSVSWIDERMIAQVRKGQKATITLRSGRVFEGEVARIGSADTVTREVEVDVKLSTLPDPLIIGEETEVAIEIGRQVAPSVPLSAIVARDGVQGVLTLEDGRARFRPVTTGLRDDHRAAVVRGLREGERVLLTPVEIQPGAKVRPQLVAQCAPKHD